MKGYNIENMSRDLVSRLGFEPNDSGISQTLKITTYTAILQNFADKWLVLLRILEVPGSNLSSEVGNIAVTSYYW
jgi:hypothetical protein